ncbi:DUF883 family protein [Rhodobacteraceae bacterium 2CG4]|uniref:DUF883 family protein n=1 Tax=Halovulum marinum TaxID=2662447 RepID=A0A6L5YXI0_9RHOB|nr:DUF883 family protein [Halovulum marinum]MSU89043.1 DUF883 family protein [Halovulum marinum]
MARAADTPSKTEPTIEDLQEQIATLRDDMAALTRTLGEYGKARAEDLSTHARDQALRAAAMGEAGLAEAQRQATDAYSQVEVKVRENPATAVGMAAAFGFLVGLVTGRR